MKAIKYLNTFALGLPLILLLISLVINDSAGNYIGFALFSTMISGFVQVVIGLFLLHKNSKNKYLQVYIAAVILFFTLWYFNMNIFYSDFLTFFLYPIPLLLVIYLSIIIYKKETL